MLRGQRLFKPSLFSVRFSSTFKTIKTGQPFTAAHRVYFEKDGQLISPFHDIPLYSDPNKKDIVNMIVEIPRWNNAKVEISTGEKFNPLKQDVKKGKPRFVRNCFPYKGYIWNYGALPQTWEDPNHSHPETNARGDNDPIDVIEIGEQVATPGQVKEVKVLGIMALLDEGETDWKVFAIDVNDPLAPKLNDIEDVEKHLPGLIRATNEWFRIYKIPDGKPENVFAFNGEAKSKKYATEIVRETHEAWKALISGNTDKKSIEVVNTTIEDSPYKIKPEPASSVKEETFDNIKEESVKEYDSKWYYV